MHTYTYTGKSTRPTNLYVIHTDVAASTMTNKNIQHCEWEEDTAEIKVTFDVELSGADKTELDGFLADF